MQPFQLANSLCVIKAGLKWNDNLIKIEIVGVFIRKIECANQNMRILVVEDEPKVASFLDKGLTESGYSVQTAFDGAMALKFVQRDAFDIILLDLHIPHINGIEVCKNLRENGNQTPILMLTALGTTEDKVLGLDAGADDYLVKPFEFSELLARIKSLSRRSSGLIQTGKILKVGNLSLDLNKRTASRDGKEIFLTAKELYLLEYLMRNKGRVIGREELAEKVWDINFDTGTNVVDVYINFLRKKVDRNFETKLIHTRIGLGYVLDAID